MARVLVLMAVMASTADAAPRTFEVRSDADLNIPLAQALADAEKAGADTLTVRIAAGTYKTSLVVRAPTTPEKLAIVVETDGKGPVVLTGTVAITGKTIALRGIVIEGSRPPAIALSLHAFESLDVQGIAVVGVRAASSERDPLVDLVARGKQARAKLRDLWIVDCTTAGTLIRIPVNGPGRWASVELDRAALAGNHAKLGIDMIGTAALAIDNSFVAEPALADGWLRADTAAAITLSHSTIVIARGLPKLKSVDLELRSGKQPPLDAKPFVTVARANKPPERAKLRALLP